MNGTAKLDPAGPTPQLELRFANCAGDFVVWMYDSNGENPKVYASGTSKNGPVDLLPVSQQIGKGIYVEAYAGHAMPTMTLIGVTVAVSQGASQKVALPQFVNVDPAKKVTFPFVVEFTS